jgi:hypothetical protein
METEIPETDAVSSALKKLDVRSRLAVARAVRRGEAVADASLAPIAVAYARAARSPRHSILGLVSQFDAGPLGLAIILIGALAVIREPEDVSRWVIAAGAFAAGIVLAIRRRRTREARALQAEEKNLAILG